MPHLYGEHIMLREYRTEDIADIRKWVNDVKSTRYLSSIFWLPQSYENTEDFVRGMVQGSGNAANFVIARKDDLAYLGQIDLLGINWKLRCGTIGIVVASEEERSHGVGAEAIGLMLRYAFQTLNLERVELELDMDNARALRCYQKAGFVLEGVKRHAYFSEGHFDDMGVMSVLAEDWRRDHPEG